MDRDNKYYNLIESLVKKHKKFPGYEAILDDIIDDVYSHSEVIINTIDNEDVIESYLSKVISTSIIVVPKKLKYNSNTVHRVISAKPESDIHSAHILDHANQSETFEIHPAIPQEPINELIKETSKTVDNDIMSYTEHIAAEKADQKLVDKMINTMNSDLVTDSKDILSESDEDDILELTDTLEPDNDGLEALSIEDNDSFSTDIEESDYREKEDEELSASDNVFETETNKTSEQLDVLEPDDFPEQLEITEETEPDKVPEPPESSESDDNLDYNLDDGTENLTEIKNLSENIASEENDENDKLEENISVNSGNILSEEQNNNNETLDYTDEQSDIVNLFENEDNNELNNDTNIIDTFISEDIEEAGLLETVNENSLDDLTEENADNTTLLVNEETDNPEIASAILEENIDLEYTQNQDANGLLDIVDNDIIELNLDENSQENELETSDDDIDNDDNSDNIHEVMEVDDEEDDDLLELRQGNTNNQIEYKPLDYNLFDYNPNEFENIADTKQISEKLISLDSSKPELKVLTIFEMRYKQNYKLEQIANELQISENDVVNTLKEISELV